MERDRCKAIAVNVPRRSLKVTRPVARPVLLPTDVTVPEMAKKPTLPKSAEPCSAYAFAAALGFAIVNRPCPIQDGPVEAGAGLGAGAGVGDGMVVAPTGAAALRPNCPRSIDSMNIVADILIEP